ncbi:acid protease [Sporormia fimetaria CBS 119925]|uniref:Acid protease n=1 Tax=Sporormia fimetaria CBS 119925 TaxID=1340428 RepID=A0A6A6VBY4_9PLEO|nr:acid protease [Sporormia fimetaria CBS 119925]
MCSSSLQPLHGPHSFRSTRFPTTLSTHSDPAGLSQQVINEHDPETSTTDGDVWNFFTWYMTTLGVGNPPQEFRARIDVNWGPLFLPSTNCTSPTCWRHAPHIYDAQRSSTYSPNDTFCRVNYPDPELLHTFGIMSEDSVHLGDMEIKEQTFESAIKWFPDTFRIERFHDTSIGLALRDLEVEGTSTTLRTPSLFQSMMAQGLLDKNLFSLALSRHDDKEGEITFGGLPQGVRREELVEIPLVKSWNRLPDSEAWNFMASAGWQVDLQNIIVEGAPAGHEVLDTAMDRTPVLNKNYTALVSTTFPYTMLPWKVVDAIDRLLGIPEESRGTPWFDCEDRDRMPDITFEFGPDGKTITLTPWDYLLENPKGCWLMFSGVDREVTDAGFVMLGVPFLHGLYSVWDAERERTGGSPKHVACAQPTSETRPGTRHGGGERILLNLFPLVLRRYGSYRLAGKVGCLVGSWQFAVLCGPGGLLNSGTCGSRRQRKAGTQGPVDFALRQQGWCGGERWLGSLDGSYGMRNKQCGGAGEMKIVWRGLAAWEPGTTGMQKWAT